MRYGFTSIHDLPSGPCCFNAAMTSTTKKEVEVSPKKTGPKSLSLSPSASASKPTSDGLQSASHGTSDGLRPTSDGLQPTLGTRSSPSASDQ